MGMKLTTSCTFPYALVRRGGVTAGKRPATKVVFLADNVVRDGKVVAHHALILAPDLRTPVSLYVRVLPDEIVKAWRKPPQPSTIAKAKRSQPRTPKGIV